MCSRPAFGGGGRGSHACPVTERHSHLSLCPAPVQCVYVCMWRGGEGRGGEGRGGEGRGGEGRGGEGRGGEGRGGEGRGGEGRGGEGREGEG